MVCTGLAINYEEGVYETGGGGGRVLPLQKVGEGGEEEEFMLLGHNNI